MSPLQAINALFLVPVAVCIVLSTVFCWAGFRRRGYGRIGAAFTLGFTTLAVSIGFGLANNFVGPRYDLLMAANVTRVVGWVSVAMACFGVYLWFNGRSRGRAA